MNCTDSHIKFLRTRWVMTKTNVFQYIIWNFILLPYQLTCFNWQRSMISSKRQLGNAYPFITLFLYEWIWCENLYNSLDRIQNNFSSFFLILEYLKSDQRYSLTKPWKPYGHCFSNTFSNSHSLIGWTHMVPYFENGSYIKWQVSYRFFFEQGLA